MTFGGHHFDPAMEASWKLSKRFWLNEKCFQKEHINQLLLIIVVDNCCWWFSLFFLLFLFSWFFLFFLVAKCWCSCRCCYQRNRQYPWCAREASRAVKGSSPWFFIIPNHKACYFWGETWQPEIGSLRCSFLAWWHWSLSTFPTSSP